MLCLMNCNGLIGNFIYVNKILWGIMGVVLCLMICKGLWVTKCDGLTRTDPQQLLYSDKQVRLKGYLLVDLFTFLKIFNYM